MKNEYKKQIEEIYQKLGYIEILPLQQQAFEMERVFERSQNVFVIGDTSSGKTLIPLVLYSIQRMETQKESSGKRERMLFVLPYRTLAAQKGWEISKMMCNIFPNLQVAVSTGEKRESDGDIQRGNVDVAVIIYEKMCRFTKLEENFLELYDMVVFDEFSLVKNEGRGIQCDMAFLYAMQSKRKIIILTTPHYRWDGYVQSGNFLLVEENSDNKGYVVPRKELPVLFTQQGNRKIGKIQILNTESGIEFPEEGTLDDIIESICVWHLQQNHRILVFINDCQEVRRHSSELYRRLQDRHEELLNPCDRDESCCFKEILERSGLLEDDLMSMMVPKECYAFMRGISYHNSWLGYELRTIVEQEILNMEGCLKVVFSTETMAYGINSNVDAVIVADMYKSVTQRNVSLDAEGKVRGERKIRTRFLTLSEYQNYIGRAGRYGQCDCGYAYPILRYRQNLKNGKQGHNFTQTKWKRLKEQKNSLEEVKSALLKLDAYCDSCPKRKANGCNGCKLAANEIGMLVLGMLNVKGLTYYQIKSIFLQLPGMGLIPDFLDFALNQALGRLVYREKLAYKITDPFDGTVRYALTVSGQDVGGIYLTLLEYNQLKNIIQNTEVKELVFFDFFFRMSCLSEIYDLAFTFFATYDKGRMRKLQQICWQALEKLYRKKQISKKLYKIYSEQLNPYHGSGVKYEILYRLLVSIMLYAWYIFGTIGNVSDFFLLDGEEVIVITPGRITNASQQFSFYIQVMSAICSGLIKKDELKENLDVMEVCLYYGIRQDIMERMGIDKLYGLNRWQRNLVAEVLEFCNSYNHDKALLTRRGKRQYRQVLDRFKKYLKDTPVGEALVSMYPEVIDLSIFD